MTSQKGIDTDCFPVLSSASVCRGNRSLYCQSAISTAGSMPGESRGFTSPTPLPASLVTCGEGQWFSWLVPCNQLTVPCNHPAEASKLVIWTEQLLSTAGECPTESCAAQRLRHPISSLPQTPFVISPIPGMDWCSIFLLQPGDSPLPHRLSALPASPGSRSSQCEHEERGARNNWKDWQEARASKKHFEFSKRVACRHLSLLTFDSL